jgi:hypothetical protein
MFPDQIFLRGNETGTRYIAPNTRATLERIDKRLESLQALRSLGYTEFGEP